MLSAVFDVAIGMLMLFVVLSAAASALSEFFSNFFKWRSKDLESFLLRTFTGDQAKSLVASFKRGDDHPDYIATEAFVKSVIAMLGADPSAVSNQATAATQSVDVNKLNDLIGKLPDNSPLKSLLTSIVATGQTDIKVISTQIGNWYDNSMTALSSWYKKHISQILLLIGLVGALIFNIDTIAYANTLFESPALRQAISAQAAPGSSSSTQGVTSSAAMSLDKLQQELKMLDLPIGWGNVPWRDASKGAGVVIWWWLLKILGLAITGFDVSQGAPFWFDLLNKVTNLCAASKPQESKPNSA